MFLFIFVSYYLDDTVLFKDVVTSTSSTIIINSYIVFAFWRVLVSIRILITILSVKSIRIHPDPDPGAKVCLGGTGLHVDF